MLREPDTDRKFRGVVRFQRVARPARLAVAYKPSRSTRRSPRWTHRYAACTTEGSAVVTAPSDGADAATRGDESGITPLPAGPPDGGLSAAVSDTRLTTGVRHLITW